MITVSKDNVHIEDSCYISKRNFKEILTKTRYADPDSKVWLRSMFSLQMEWAVHNALHALGLWKDRTRDVDLNYPNKVEVIYCICGIFVWPFIR